MGVRAAHGNVEAFAGQNVGGRRAAADKRRARGRQRAVNALRPAGAKLQNAVAARRQTNPRRFGRNQGLEIDQVQQRRLQKLALQNVALHPHHRLVRKTNRALAQRLDVHAQFQSAQIFQELRLEQRFIVGAFERAEVFQIGVIEAEVLDPFERRFDAAGHGKAAIKRLFAEKELEVGFVLRAARFPVAVGHGELVEVGQKGGRAVEEDVAHGRSIKSGANGFAFTERSQSNPKPWRSARDGPPTAPSAPKP